MHESAHLGVADMFLSLPTRRIRLSKRVVQKLWSWINKIENFCYLIEAREIHVTERIVEIPFVLQRLPKSGQILDIGCTSSALSLQLACSGYQVSGVDVRPYDFSHPNFTFYHSDVTSASLEPDFYDCAILLSVIEHVGLGCYGDTTQTHDRAFLERIAHWVRPGGTILLTVPFGEFFEGKWYRVYDSEKLAALVSGFQMTESKFARRLSLMQWQLCQKEDLAQVRSTKPPIQGVALLEIRRPQ